MLSSGHFYADANGSTAKGAAYNEIAQNFPDWANRSIIKELASPDVKAFDAAGAENFFTNIDDFNRLLTSRVDGISYRRNGIPSANFSRKIATTVEKTARAVFSPTISAKTNPEVLAKVDKEATDVMQVLKTVADSDDTLINPNVNEILKLGKNVSFVQRQVEKLGTALSRSPGRILFGEDAAKTSQDFRNLANLATGNARIADALVESFLDETVENQITIVRNLYQAVMTKVGMAGSPGGEAHMAQILSSTFNELGMGSAVRTEIPLDFADVISPSAFRMENDVPLMTGKGVIQPSQLTEGIAPLPYDLIYQYGAASKRQAKGQALIANGGAIRNDIIRKYTDFWANFTLFPRLGVRSAIDEAFFMYMAAPWYNVRQYLTGAAVKPSRVLESITGSKSSIGMYRRLAYRVPAEEIYGDTLTPEMWSNIRKLMKHNPQVLDSVVNSLAARSSISGKMDIDLVDTMFTPSNLSKVYEDYGLTASKKFRPINVSKMGEKQQAIAHYRNFSLRFPYNSKTIAQGIYISPATAFFKNNALKTVNDFTAARNELLEKVGVAYSDEIGGFAIANEAAVKAFNNKFSSSVYSRQQGLGESEIARLHVERMLLDMRNTFHGAPNSFNQKLLDAIKEKHREIIDFRIQAGAKKRKGLVDGDEFGGAWENAAASLTFKDFEDMTVGMHPMGEINTDLVTMGEVKDMKIFEDNSGLDHIFSKFQNWSMEVMDAQVTGMYRQKALWIAYDANMGRLKPYEKMLYERYKQANISSGQNIGQAERHAKALAEKRVTEIAWRQSTEEILEYVDNPNIRSNMAIAIRSVGRFYRATEDFYRRLYRVFGKTPLRSLYRLRLLNTGLDANGDIYEDDKGDKYIIFPTDTIINSAVEPVVRAFTGNEDFNIPTFNELSLKLRLINPSFAPDAGYPALSGPAGAYSTLVLKSLVGQVVPFLERLGLSEEKADVLEAKTKKGQDIIAKIGLGNFADTTNFANAAIPMFFSTLGQALATLTIDEQAIRDNELNRQQTSAVMQAMRYFQAFGLGIDESATEEEKYKYQKNLKIATSNIIIARTILGYISPGMPTFKESKDLPEFLKKVGITGFKAEFWDIYDDRRS